MEPEEFDKKFDDGKEDMFDDLDLSTARRINQITRRINIDFPSAIVDELDTEARRIGVTRQSLIKVWIHERLQAEARERNPVSAEVE